MKGTKTPEFVLSDKNPYREGHTRLDEYLKNPKRSSLPAESAKFDKPLQSNLLCAALERAQFQKQNGRGVEGPLTELVKKVAGRKLVLTDDELVWNLRCAAAILAPKDPKNVLFDELESPIPGVVPALLEHAETLAKEKRLPKEMLEPLTRLHAVLKPMEFWAGYKKTVQRLESLVEQKKAGVPDDGEAWAEAIRADIEKMPTAKRKQWLALLDNAPKGSSATPTAKWKKQADELLAAVGAEDFARQTEHWFALVGAKATDRIQLRNANLLRALVWYASLLKGETVCRALANAAEGGLRKVAAGGLYASSISKACIAALEQMDGLEPLAQLSRLKHRVKSPWGLQEIEKAFTNAVQRSGISRAEVEEISTPTFGLDAESKLRQQVGDFTAELRIAGSKNVEVRWFDAKNNELGEAPKLPKTQAAEQKAFKQLASDIEKMLKAQSDRIENFLEKDRAWEFSTWRARYLDRALLGPMSRRLIWQFQEGKQSASGIWSDGNFVQSNGRKIEWLSAKTSVRLWHPLGVEPAQVQEWRRWLEEHLVTQPFKQAHREIYIITDAELTTRTYSNRFAAHILRQHQFNALCNQRGWRYDFLGSWDQSESTASRDLPGWDLRAEFWIQQCDSEFSDAGVAMHVATDQVRFRNPTGGQIPLTEIPAIVFSEIMRDVDLFVSVCSVGNDPQWADAGDDRQREYWREWSFGALNATASTRRDILARLLPKLKIADRCSLEERFLVVRGKLRTYKIHLGSSNIQMEPNNQYLCIVPDRPGAKLPGEDSKVFLPFEGDHTLSVILSKAFMLAADDKIKDPSILSQLRS